MSGLPDFNCPAFEEAAREMRGFGWEVISPNENHGGRTDLPREEYFRTDIPQLVTCDAILMLKGWEKSEGAKLELAIARACGIRAIRFCQEPVTALLWDDLLRDDEAGAGSGRWERWPREEREAALPKARIFGQEFVLQIQGAAKVVPFTVGDAPPDPFRAVLARWAELHDKKKADYTGGEHPLANYINSAESIGVTPVQAMFSRLSEKWFRAKVLLSSGAAPQNESLADTFTDIGILSVLIQLAMDPESGYAPVAA